MLKTRGETRCPSEETLAPSAGYTVKRSSSEECSYRALLVGETAITMSAVVLSCEEWDVMNKMKPIWLRNPDVVNESEYTEFYKTRLGP